MSVEAPTTLTLFLCGDVMPGRGLDQVLAYPGDPALREPYVHEAWTYVHAAESVHGPIVRPVSFGWPWGESLRVLNEVDPAARVINLECGITRAGSFAQGKSVHYRMNPGNVGVLTAGKPDVCTLANNHVLDFGPDGLGDTLDALYAANIHVTGAGRNAEQARTPAVITRYGTRLVIVAYGAASSGIPPGWAAGADRCGVNFLPDLDASRADEIAEHLPAGAEAGNVAIVSLHWGANWAEEVPDAHVHFARRLVDAGADVVHGHSSHHPMPVEIYRGRLILYGCGDFIDDYEGIPGHEQYRHDLRVLYLPTLRRDTGELVRLRMVPMRPEKMRLYRAPPDDSRWLAALLSRDAQRFGVQVSVETDGSVLATPS